MVYLKNNFRCFSATILTSVIIFIKYLESEPKIFNSLIGRDFRIDEKEFNKFLEKTKTK